LDCSEKDIVAQEKDGKVEGDRAFHKELRETIQKHFDEFPEGDVYYQMREVFDSEVAQEGIRRTSKAKLASKRIGVAYKTFRKMLGWRRKL